MGGSISRGRYGDGAWTAAGLFAVPAAVSTSGAALGGDWASISVFGDFEQPNAKATTQTPCTKRSFLYSMGIVELPAIKPQRSQRTQSSR
jgi:hypothetical protein